MLDGHVFESRRGLARQHVRPVGVPLFAPKTRECKLAAGDARAGLARQCGFYRFSEQPFSVPASISTLRENFRKISGRDNPNPVEPLLPGQLKRRHKRLFGLGVPIETHQRISERSLGVRPRCNLIEIAGRLARLAQQHEALIRPARFRESDPNLVCDKREKNSRSNSRISRKAGSPAAIAS